MGSRLQILGMGLILAAGLQAEGKGPVPSAQPPVRERLARALESGDRALLAPLFPSERKIRVALHRIADLEGFTGSGPLVEAFARYLAGRQDVRFETDPPDPEGTADPLRLRGTLSSRASGRPRERVSLVFLFETIGESHLVVEVREAG